MVRGNNRALRAMSTTNRNHLIEQIGGPSSDVLDRLIYVVGSARGGTSITQAIIAQHQAVIAMGGPSSFLNHVWRYRKRLHDRLWRQLLWTPGYLRRTEVLQSLTEGKRQAFLRLINIACEEKDLHQLYRLYPLTRALDPDETRDPSSLMAWLDKGNDFWGVRHLPKAFPKGRFVIVLRDPRGAVASLAKRTADLRADTRFKTEPQDIIRNALYWRNLVRQEQRFARRHPDQTILFRFEELTANPVRVAQALYSALDLPALPNEIVQKSLDGQIYSASNDAADAGTGISTTPNERWKNVLNESEQDLVAEICGPTARALGYSIQPPKVRRGWFGILRMVPGGKAKLQTLTKLVFLFFAERLQGRPGNSARSRELVVE